MAERPEWTNMFINEYLGDRPTGASKLGSHANSHNQIPSLTGDPRTISETANKLLAFSFLYFYSKFSICYLQFLPISFESKVI